MQSSSSSTIAVEKATSDLLMSPDWTMNMQICDIVNSSSWHAKDVVKAVKRRLQNKHHNIQLLALTLLETMVKNCGEHVHIQIAERNVLGEMVKIVRKKPDMRVRDRILMLLDSWQEAFGGPGGKNPQYYWAYDELWRSRIEFPKRSLEGAPIFTPPVSCPTPRHADPGYGMPSNSARRLDETMARGMEGASLSSMDSMHYVMDLLNDMLQAVNPGDSAAVKDEVIVDLVNSCRANQKKLMQMLTTTGIERLLARGIELNDNLQSLLAKHDAIASGSLLPNQVSSLSSQHSGTPVSSPNPTEARPLSSQDSSPKPDTNNLAHATVTSSHYDEEEEEEEDEFAQLARRHSKMQPMPSQSYLTDTSDGATLLDRSNAPYSSMPPASTAAPCTELALPDTPESVRTTTKEQDVIDLLSFTLSATSVSSPTPSAFNQNMPGEHIPSMDGYDYISQSYPGDQGYLPYNNYVAPWAQPQTQQPSQNQSQQQFDTQYNSTQCSSGYPAPPWATSSGFPNNQNGFTGTNMFVTPRSNTTTPFQNMPPARSLQHHNSLPARGTNRIVATQGDQWVNFGTTHFQNMPPVRSLQHHNSLPAGGTNGIVATQGDQWVNFGSRNSLSSTAQKPFVPSYRLFEELNVFGNADVRPSNTLPSLAGNSGQGMVGWPK